MRGSSHSRRISMCAIFTALIVVLLYLSSLFPVMSLSIIAIAGVLPAILVHELGLSSALISYAAASVLSLVLVPDKSNALLFVLLFGHYPVIKCLAERVKPMWFTWLIKLVCANILFWVTWLLFKALFFSAIEQYASLVWLLWLAFNAIFVMYDICLKKLVIFYEIRLARHLR